MLRNLWDYPHFRHLNLDCFKPLSTWEAMSSSKPQNDLGIIGWLFVVLEEASRGFLPPSSVSSCSGASKEFGVHLGEQFVVLVKLCRFYTWENNL